MDLKAQYVQNYKLNVAGKNPIPHLSVIVSLKQTTKVCIQQSNSEKMMTSTTRKAEDIHVSLHTEQIVVPAKFSVIERLLTR